MKSRFISMLFTVAISLLATPSFSLTAEQNAEKLAKQLQKISLQAAKLQKEMRSLKAELRQMKKEKANVKVQPKGTGHPMLDHLPTVVTSPLVGLRSEFDGSDLLVNLPSMGEDLRLLRQRQQLVNKLGGYYPYADRPIIELSGLVEGMAFARKATAMRHMNSINLSSAELDVLIEASPWALGFMSLNYDDAPIRPTLRGTPAGSRVANSNVFLKRGFITLGNLTKSPFYFSIGQMYTDFGRYSSAIVTTPMTLTLGRINARQVQVGYAKAEGLSFSGYLFQGDTNTGNAGIVNQGGVNLRYKVNHEDSSANVGVGVVSSIAESSGMQDTGLTAPRQGFAINTTPCPTGCTTFSNELMVHRVPAIDVHAELSKGPWSFMGEFIAATKAFSPINMTYNGRGAKPTALHLELNRKFEVFGKPSNASIAFDHSSQALAIGLPRDSYIAAFNISPVKSTLLGIEFRHDRNYRVGDTALMAGLGAPAPATAFTSAGGSVNTVSALLDLYF